MRVFVALPVPREVRNALVPAVEALRERWPDPRWTDPAGWHLTLAFLGEVADDVAPSVVAEVTSAAAELPPVPLEVPASASTPPARRRRRRGVGGIVWLEVTEGGSDRSSDRSPGALAEVAEAVRDACERAGTEPDRRLPFRGHITLCRTSERHHPEPAQLAQEVAAAWEGPSLGWTAERVEILRSQTTPEGARHDVLGEAELGGTAGRRA